MKKSILTLTMTFILATISFSQVTPKVDQRQHNQKARIKQGVKSGELTAKETKQLAAQQRNIKRTEMRTKADGVVTAKERAVLAKKQEIANKNIARKKHNKRDRN